MNAKKNNVHLDRDKLWLALQSQDWGTILANHIEKPRQGHGKWTGLCPFHGETHPSFSWTDEGVYCCFACNARGNFYTFCSEITHTSGYEVWVQLADWSGLNIDEYVDPTDSDLWRIEREAIEIKPRIQAYFRRCLTSDHLQKSGKAHLLSPGICDRFGIGYCGHSTDLLRKLKGHISPEALALTGLVTESGKLTLSDHIVFPALDRGQLMGWTGRNLSYNPEARTGPKWFHAGFQKNRLSFGLDTMPKDGDVSIFCEGPWDLIACTIAVPDARVVASLGTTPSDRTLSRLRGKDAIICLDSDEAGKKSTKALIRRLLQSKISFSFPQNISVAVLPPGLDPADPQLSPQELRAALLNPVPWHFWWDSTLTDDLPGIQALRDDLSQWNNIPYEAFALEEAARATKSPLFAQEVGNTISACRGIAKQRRPKATPLEHPLKRAWAMPFLGCGEEELADIRQDIAIRLRLSPEEVAHWNTSAVPAPSPLSRHEFYTFYNHYVLTHRI